MAELSEKLLFELMDIVVTPAMDTQLMATNLTGNPAVILPERRAWRKRAHAASDR